MNHVQKMREADSSGGNKTRVTTESELLSAVIIFTFVSQQANVIIEQSKP